MAEEDQSQKTEEPSQRKLQEARRKGQVATSQEVKHAFALLAGTLIVAVFMPLMGPGLVAKLGGLVGEAHRIDTDPGALLHLLEAGAGQLALFLLLPMALVVALGVGACLIQHGWLVSAESLKPKLNKISPLAGLKRMVSLKSLVELLKGLLKIALVMGLGWLVIAPEFSALESMAGMTAAEMMERIWLLAIKLMLAVLALMALVAGADFAYQRWEFLKQQRMTKQEVKDEFKQTEGDPLIKARLRSIRTERARRRMMAAVPGSDVVITNPTHFAVAMKYDPGTMAAPKVTAKGADLTAQRIRQLAREHDVPVVENPPLARMLYDAVEVDEEVAPEHYKAVAEVIAYVFRLQGRAMPAG